MNSFLEASSEISSIFGGSFGDDMRSGGAAQAAGNQPGLDMYNQHSSAAMSAPVPVRSVAAVRVLRALPALVQPHATHELDTCTRSVLSNVAHGDRARPPLPPGNRTHGVQQRSHLGPLGDQLRTGGGTRSASPHHIIRSPFEDTGISLELAHVMNTSPPFLFFSFLHLILFLPPMFPLRLLPLRLLLFFHLLSLRAPCPNSRHPPPPLPFPLPPLPFFPCQYA